MRGEVIPVLCECGLRLEPTGIEIEHRRKRGAANEAAERIAGLE